MSEIFTALKFIEHFGKKLICPLIKLFALCKRKREGNKKETLFLTILKLWDALLSLIKIEVPREGKEDCKKKSPKVLLPICYFKLSQVRKSQTRKWALCFLDAY
jgi:hypothetical protein